MSEDPKYAKVTWKGIVYVQWMRTVGKWPKWTWKPSRWLFFRILFPYQVLLGLLRFQVWVHWNPNKDSGKAFWVGWPLFHRWLMLRHLEKRNLREVIFAASGKGTSLDPEKLPGTELEKINLLTELVWCGFVARN